MTGYTMVRMHTNQYCDGDITPTTNRIVLAITGMMATKIMNDTHHCVMLLTGVGVGAVVGVDRRTFPWYSRFGYNIVKINEYG